MSTYSPHAYSDIQGDMARHDEEGSGGGYPDDANDDDEYLNNGSGDGSGDGNTQESGEQGTKRLNLFFFPILLQVLQRRLYHAKTST